MPLKHANMSDLQRLNSKTQWNFAQRLHKLQLQNRIATPKRKNDDFEALFKSKFKSTIRNKWKKSAAEAPFATFTQPLQCKSRLSAKHKSITHAPAAARNLDTAIPLRSAQTDLHNTLELQHATVEHIALMHQSQYTKCRNTCKTQ